MKTWKAWGTKYPTHNERTGKMWPNQTPEEKNRILDEAAKRLAAEEEEARRTRMVIVKHSKFRWRVAVFCGTRVLADRDAKNGIRVRQIEWVFGPATEAACHEFVANAVAVAAKEASVEPGK